ncbi:MAG: UPF0280 family protein [Clostridiales bacterium]|jgi:ApbE superfamily uncharacterized protein (UPF0280 family)|nr:UPF0280 family protein [Clostridiales bacterium]
MILENREVYRASYGAELETVCLACGETDLAICLPGGIWQPSLKKALLAHIAELRTRLQSYIALDPTFAASHTPYTPAACAPAMAWAMSRAASVAGVGPMAAVAGAFAQAAGEFLLAFCPEVIVENGGDIYLATGKERLVGIYAGPDNPFTDQLAIKISADAQPLGICTSSGTVGPSFSYGRADAAVILAPDPLLADAAATALGNRIKKEQDVEAAVEFASTIPGITGALAIHGKTLAAWGSVELAPLEKVALM